MLFFAFPKVCAAALDWVLVFLLSWFSSQVLKPNWLSPFWSPGSGSRTLFAVAENTKRGDELGSEELAREIITELAIEIVSE